MEEHLGFDATVAFRSAGHSTDAFTMLNEYLIGILPKNERIYENRIRWWKRKKNKCHKNRGVVRGGAGGTLVSTPGFWGFRKEDSKRNGQSITISTPDLET